MSFANFASAQSFFLWSAFAIALVLGAVVNKTNFCTMGAVSDWVNMGDTGRLRAWVLAIAVAVLGVMALEAAGLINLSGTFPPYRQNNLVWLENVFGGVMFGIGMTLASGCGNKMLIRIGGGNLKSIMVLLVIALIAYFMTNPFPGSDKTLYSTLFYPWTHPAAVALSTNQDLGALFFGEKVATGRLVMGGIVGVLLLAWVKQPIRQATAWGKSPRLLIHDNDGICGPFRDRKRRGEKGRRYRCRLDLWLADLMGIEGIPIAYGAPKASPHIERLNRTLRKEALHHFIFLNVSHVRRVGAEYREFYHGARPSQALHAIADPYPELATPPPTNGKLTALPVLGGVQHDYRLAA